MLKIVKYIFSAGILAGATAAAASDLPPEVLEGVMHSCRPDYHRVCSYVVPGDGRVGRCLLDHEQELAPVCLKAIKLAYAIEVCLPDYHRYCGGVPQGAESVECLAERIESLAPECQRVVSANAPYIAPHSPRYGYNQSPAPYADRFHAEAYRYREVPRDADRYEQEPERRFQSYGERHADRDYEREQTYDAGRYHERETYYGAPHDRYEPEEGREQLK